MEQRRLPIRWSVLMRGLLTAVLCCGALACHVYDDDLLKKPDAGDGGAQDGGLDSGTSNSKDASN